MGSVRGGSGSGLLGCGEGRESSRGIRVESFRSRDKLCVEGGSPKSFLHFPYCGAAFA